MVKINNLFRVQPIEMIMLSFMNDLYSQTDQFDDDTKIKFLYLLKMNKKFLSK